MRAPFLALTLLAALALGCGDAAVHHGLDEGQANAMVVVLHEAGIDAHTQREEGRGTATYTLLVGHGDRARAVKLLQVHGLPRRRPEGFGELMGKPSLIPTATQEQALRLAALQGELSRTLEEIEGVVAARVHLALPDRQRLDTTADQEPPRASVLLKTRPGVTVVAADVTKVVAGSVRGLAPERVAVVVTMGAAPPVARQDTNVTVGPFRVARGSRGRLLAVLVVGLVLVIGLSGAVALLGLRVLRRRQAPLDEPTGTPVLDPTRDSVELSHLRRRVVAMADQRPGKGSSAEPLSRGG